jgi:hypothetical protein
LATDSISFSVNPGVYDYSVLPVANYTASPSSGGVFVNLPYTQVNISFTSSLIPIGTAFAAGNPIVEQCPTGYIFANNGCNAGDYTYTLTIEASSVEFGSVLFSVKTSVGTYYTVLPSPGGFSIAGVAGNVEAQTNTTQMGNELWMTSGWSTYWSGVGPTYPLTSVDVILIDVGLSNPTGMGLTFVVTGTGNYTGTTAPLVLP